MGGVEESVGEAFVGYLELGITLCDVYHLEEHNSRIFEELEKSGEQLLTLFAGTLFDWYCAWGLTSSDSLPLFIDSLFLCT